ncbi:cysteine synthase family protein [Patescibacteria group bacterium]|nr:cysteine synthase family protein [Patescibacteria group bacterium]
MLYQNILESIGNTPIVKINKQNTNSNVNLYLKLEGQNPGGSVKDRIALNMIETAEKSGELTNDKIILEPTSGNTGIGLAMVAAFKGYKVTLTMSEGMSEERKRMLKALGAELVLTPANQGTDGAIRKAHEMNNNDPDKYWMPNQFSNPANPDAHYKTTAEEVLSDVPEITHFIAGLGTSGTLIGTGKRLKEVNPDIKIIAAEPILGHKVQGLKNMKEAIVPEIYDGSAYDEKIQVEDKIVHDTVRKLALTEGIFVGMSTGAALHIGVELADKLTEGNIVVISPDRGEKYLSTILFE